MARLPVTRVCQGQLTILSEISRVRRRGLGATIGQPASPAEPRFGEADLSNCERELIHLSGSIQPHGVLLVLTEPRFVVVQASANTATALGLAPDVLMGSPVETLGFSAAEAIPALADLVVREMQELTGYDRVMVYRFDPDGHGEIIAEERRADLESFLHRHYPATDIPQRARELYLRNKVRLLVDARYVPVPLVPRENPVTGEDLDLSMAVLRSISPMHTQYLQNMGVTGTVVASLIHDGKLWGLISCHHYSAKYLPYDLRAAVELIAEVVSTRISALASAARRPSPGWRSAAIAVCAACRSRPSSSAS